MVHWITFLPLHFVFLGLFIPFSSAALSLLQDFPSQVRAGASDTVEGLSLPPMGDKIRGRCKQAGSLGVSELPAEGDKAGFLGGRTSKHPQWGWGGPGHACLYPEAGASTLSPNTWAWAPCRSVCVQPGWLRLGLVLEPRAWFNQKGHRGPLHPPYPSAAQSWDAGVPMQLCYESVPVHVCVCVWCHLGSLAQLPC